MQSQFYAPDTEYHDRVQRMFPVEAARVLAWDSGRSTNGIAEVTYNVTTAKNGTTTWHIGWIDSKKKELKSATVEYPLQLLKEGPRFYREVLRQLFVAGWSNPSQLKPVELEEAFWRGASEAGVNRETSVDRALRLAAMAKSSKGFAWAPEMAGLLVHSALPALYGHLTLDVNMEARSAAWLALAEKSAGTEMPQLWAPVLFIGGRQQSAVGVWTNSLSRPSVNSGMKAGWDLMLKGPITKDIYLFAVDSTNSGLGMGMIGYDASINSSGQLMAHVLQPLAGTGRAFQALHNYAPLIVGTAGVGGGHIMDGGWPLLQRIAWISLLSAHPGLTNQGVDFSIELQKATKALSLLSKPTNELDRALLGFSETVQLIRLGHDQGTGLLVPTGSVSERDILNYGWEMAGLQMGTRYHFVAHKWGNPEQAQPILEAITSEAQSLLPFFLKASAAVFSDYQADLFRLQHVDGLQLLVGGSPSPFARSRADSTNGSTAIFMKRCWLRPTELDWQARGLWDSRNFPAIGELLKAAAEESGPRGAIMALKYLTPITLEDLVFIPEAAQLKQVYARKLPLPNRLSLNVGWSEFIKGKNGLQIAQELEKLYWKNPNQDFASIVFAKYLNVGDLLAARRFYHYARDDFEDPVSISNSLGYNAWALGFALNDPLLRQKALEDSESGSASDMDLNILESALLDKRADLKDQVEELIERYQSSSGPRSSGHRLLGFVPLIPALADAKHPDHQRALDYFGKRSEWILLRWVWVETFKLSKADAIAFLGGREASPFQQLLVAYLEADQKKFDAVMFNMVNPAAPFVVNEVIAQRLKEKLHQIKPVAGPDLKPADALSARAAVMKRLKEKGLSPE